MRTRTDLSDLRADAGKPRRYQPHLFAGAGLGEKDTTRRP